MNKAMIRLKAVALMTAKCFAQEFRPNTGAAPCGMRMWIMTFVCVVTDKGRRQSLAMYEHHEAHFMEKWAIEPVDQPEGVI